MAGGLVSVAPGDLRRQVRAVEGGVLYTSAEVCALADLSYRVLWYWTHTRLILPVQEARGSGTKCLWSADDVGRVLVLASLRRAGANRDVMDRAALFLGVADWPDAGLLVVPTSGEPYRVADGAELDERIAEDPRPLWLVDLDEVTAALRRDAEVAA